MESTGYHIGHSILNPLITSRDMWKVSFFPASVYEGAMAPEVLAISALHFITLPGFLSYRSWVFLSLILIIIFFNVVTILYNKL